MSKKYETNNYIAFHKALEQMLEAMIIENEPYCEANIEMDNVDVEMTVAFKEITND